MSRKKRKARKPVAKAKRTFRGITYRSGLECRIAKRLAKLEILNDFEPFKIPYILPKSYTPDFKISGTEIILEAKGVLLPADRQKMLAVKRQNPELDIRFVFEKPHQKCGGPGIKATHAEWAEAHGFPWYSVEDLGRRTLK